MRLKLFALSKSAVRDTFLLVAGSFGLQLCAFAENGSSEGSASTVFPLPSPQTRTSWSDTFSPTEEALLAKDSSGVSPELSSDPLEGDDDEPTDASCPETTDDDEFLEAEEALIPSVVGVSADAPPATTQRSPSSADIRDDGGIIEDAVPESGALAGTKAGTSGRTHIAESPGGICSHITVAHLLVRLGVVDPEWGGVVRGEYWDTSFLDLIWRIAGRRGMTAMGANWHTRYLPVTCSVDQLESSIFERWMSKTPVERWCRRMARNLCFGYGVTLRVQGRPPRPGHIMPMLSSEWSERRRACYVRTVNTGFMGIPYGDRVPRNPGEQMWIVRGDPDLGLFAYPRSGAFAVHYFNENYDTVFADVCVARESSFVPFPGTWGSVWSE